MSWVTGAAVGLAAIGAAILLFRFLAFVAEWDVRSFEVPQDLPLRRTLGELRDLLRDEAKRTGGERRTEVVRRFVLRHSKIPRFRRLAATLILLAEGVGGSACPLCGEIMLLDPVVEPCPCERDPACPAGSASPFAFVALFCGGATLGERR